jgi:hypothetical protein
VTPASAMASMWCGRCCCQRRRADGWPGLPAEAASVTTMRTRPQSGSSASWMGIGCEILHCGAVIAAARGKPTSYRADPVRWAFSQEIRPISRYRANGRATY